MIQVNIHKAKSSLSSLIEKALKGEKVVIAKNGKPLVRLEKETKKTNRVPGRLKGKIWMAKDFDEMPKELMQYFK